MSVEDNPATFEPLPFDAAAARAYGRIYAGAIASGRKARGRRAVDLLIAAVALAADLPLYTCNAGDFAGLSDELDVRVAMPAQAGSEDVLGGSGVRAAGPRGRPTSP